MIICVYLDICEYICTSIVPLRNIIVDWFPKTRKSIRRPILRNEALLYFFQRYIICTVIRQAFHGSLNHKMDRTFWLLMVAACVCGSYRNSSQVPEPYTENLARSLGNERNERTFSVPHYVHGYKEIISGKRHFRYNLKFLPIS